MMIVRWTAARAVARKRNLNTPRLKSGEQRPDTHETSSDKDNSAFNDSQNPHFD
jgi:hypothetical protein